LVESADKMGTKLEIILERKKIFVLKIFLIFNLQTVKRI